MPIFEYICNDCNSNFELLIRSIDQDTKCPQCGSEQVTKLISTFAHNTASSFQEPSSSSGCNTCSSKNCAQCN